MKRIIAILLAGMLTVSAASCANNVKGTPKGTADENKIVINSVTEPGKINSLLCNDAQGGNILRMTMSGLTRLDENDVPQLDLAESYTTSEDKKTYTFKLRQDAKWSNGEPVTAKDFVFAWRKVVDKATASSYAFFIYSNILNGEAVYNGEKSPEELGVKAIDDYTLEVKLENPLPYFLHLVSFYTFLPLNEKAYNEIGADKYATDADKFVTNGPYKMVSWEHENNIEFTKNPDYWNAENFSVENVKYVMLKDENASLNAWRGNEVDIINVSGTQRETLEKEDVKVESYNDNSSWYLQFNTQKPGLKNAKIRGAIARAIDTASLCTNVLKNGSVPATGLTPGGINGIDGKKFVDSLGTLIEYNLDEAKKLLEEGLKEEGLTADQLTIDYITDDTPSAGKISQYVQEQLKKSLGLKVDIRQMPFKSRLDAMDKGDFGIVFAGWTPDYNDPMTFLDMFMTTNGNNYGKYSNPKYDELVSNAQKELDTAKRQDLLIEAEKLLISDAVIAPVFFSSKLYVVSEKVKGYTASGFQEFFTGNGVTIATPEKK